MAGIFNGCGGDSGSVTETVPSKNSTDNSIIRDVIGNKTDDEDGNSLYAQSYILKRHIHSPSKVYPTLAAGVTLTTSNSNWTLGSVTQVVPINTITSPFDIHYIGIEGISNNDVFELVLYYGASDTECGRVRFIRSATLDATINVPVLTGTATGGLIPANSKISAALACAAGSSKTATISIWYHTY